MQCTCLSEKSPNGTIEVKFIMKINVCRQISMQWTLHGNNLPRYSPLQVDLVTGRSATLLHIVVSGLFGDDSDLKCAPNDLRPDEISVFSEHV